VGSAARVGGSLVLCTKRETKPDALIWCGESRGRTVRSRMRNAGQETGLGGKQDTSKGERRMTIKDEPLTPGGKSARSLEKVPCGIYKVKEC